MRDSHIGDSLDCSKRTILRIIRGAEPNLRVQVAALPSQQQFDSVRYCRILDLSPDADLLVPTIEPFRGPSRARHLRAIATATFAARSTLFLLDPDTGLHRTKATNRFLTLSELRTLVPQASDSAVAVYHHRGAGKLSKTDILEALADYTAFAYDFGAAILVFVSRGERLASRLKQACTDGLSPIRIHPNGS